MLYLLLQKRLQFAQLFASLQVLFVSVFPLHRTLTDGTADDLGLLQRLGQVYTRKMPVNPFTIFLSILLTDCHTALTILVVRIWC